MRNKVSCWDAIIHKNKVKDVAAACVWNMMSVTGDTAQSGTKMKPIVVHTLLC